VNQKLLENEALMTFYPGDPKPPNSGRRAGTPNKRTAQVQNALTDMVLDLLPALQKSLEEKYTAPGYKERKDFIDPTLKLLGLVMPRGGPIVMEQEEDSEEPPAVTIPNTSTPTSDPPIRI
jgi:hypothetical protein